MARTDNFKKHHVEILTISKSINTLLASPRVGEQASEIRRLLSQLHGKLSFHLAMEDKSLYPYMMSHPDPNVKNMAKRYADEMGSLAETFKDYLDRWGNAMTINANLPEFVKESKAIFTTLVKRIQREDVELYPLVDKLSS